MGKIGSIYISLFVYSRCAMFLSKDSSLKKIHCPSVSAIDLFCGAGGLTKGLVNAGIDVCLGIDCDPACEYPYTANNRAEFRLESVEKVEGKLLESYYPKNVVRLLAGCAPCQTFSTYYQKYVPQASEDDKRWSLLLQFSRLVNEIRPEVVTMENVPGLEKQPVFMEFVNSLKSMGYKVSHSIVHCEEYGIPQHRSRLVLLASLLGNIRLLSPKDIRVRKRTVRQAIGKLPEIDAGTGDSKDPLHMSSELSPINLRRIRCSKPGGTWRDWPKNLVADCHKKKSGKTYPSVYGRMEWDKASPTITTQFFGFGNGRFGHPEQDRALSLREGAILQSFPRRYRFSHPGEPICLKAIGRMIGNAVPVKLGEVIGKSIFAHIEFINTQARSK